MLVGVDPGLNGALVLLSDGFIVDCVDMPTTFSARKTKSDKRVVDAAALVTILTGFQRYGAWLAVIEEVGGLPGQSAPAAFSFGFGAGLLYGIARGAGFAVEHVKPQTWKSAMRIGTNPQTIRARANELFPGYESLWAVPARSRNSKTSEACLGRAEAAILALYGARTFTERTKHDNRKN